MYEASLSERVYKKPRFIPRWPAPATRSKNLSLCSFDGCVVDAEQLYREDKLGCATRCGLGAGFRGRAGDRRLDLLEATSLRSVAFPQEDQEDPVLVENRHNHYLQTLPRQLSIVNEAVIEFTGRYPERRPSDRDDERYPSRVRSAVRSCTAGGSNEGESRHACRPGEANSSVDPGSPGLRRPPIRDFDGTEVTRSKSIPGQQT